MKKEVVIVVTGATASGKSSLIYSLPQNTAIEVIICDSRQSYKYLQIGTAAPNSLEQQKFPHHLLQFLDFNQRFSAGDFLAKTRILIEEIHARKKTPVILGGTFFYVKALWDGLMPSPSISASEMRKIYDEINLLPLVEVRQRLQVLDSGSCHKIDAKNDYRNRRALIATLQSGKPFSQFELIGGVYNKYDFQSFYLDRERQELYSRINERTQRMFTGGNDRSNIVSEFEYLLKNCESFNDPVFNSIGYRQLLDEYLTKLEKGGHGTPQQIEAITKAFYRKIQRLPNDTKNIGESSHLLWNSTTSEPNKLIKQTIRQLDILQITEKTAQLTRNYAKRQLTWFRNETRLKRIDHDNLFLLLSQSL